MKRNLAGLLVVGVVAYIGLSFMEGSGGVSPYRSGLDDSVRTIVSLPPADFYPTDLKLTRAPNLRCASAIVIDNQTNQILYEKKAQQKRSIASITKLLAAITLIESDFDLNEKITITKWDAQNSSRSVLRIGETFYAKDLFYLALISSDNRAIKALARSSGLPYTEFIQKMNEQAHKIGMDSTSVIDPSGIYQDNTSTAADCIKLLNHALEYSLIKSALTCLQYECRSLNHKRLVRVVNTNRLLRSKWKVAGGKTGYISASGYCLVTRIQNDYGADITTVVLGSPSNNYRFAETQKIAAWAFDNLDHRIANGG